MPKHDPFPPAHTPLLTLAQAAEHLSVSVLTVRRRIAAGELPAYRLGSGPGLRVRVEDVEALLRPLPTVARRRTV